MEKQDSLDLFAEQGKYIKGKPIVTIFHNEQNLIYGFTNQSRRNK